MQRPLISVKPGQWVTATAGRDRGTHYLVMKVIDDRWIQVVDGVRRTPSKPKKKSLRHVWVRDEIAPELGAKFEKDADVSNSEIQSALKALVREEEEVG